MIKHIILTSSDPIELDGQIAGFLTIGWKLRGNLIVSTSFERCGETSRGDPVYAQAMVLRSEEIKPK